MSNLVDKFQQYSGWRKQALAALEQYRLWAAQADLCDPASEDRIARLRTKLSTDKLSVAFVAEFSRGKSELINAIFFAGYGQRVLPSAAGRTTMCPTELLYEESAPPSIRLLPIETRTQARSVVDFKEDISAWTVLPLDVSSASAMLEAFQQVSLTRRVPVEQAQSLGLWQEEHGRGMLEADAQGGVEIPRWRHAIVNLPHPLLKEGLVIVDTPGLNAIGTEPELTLNLIPSAHAVLFILAADTGVTQSDAEVWREHIGSGSGRLVVLNKIDSMWDELRGPEQVEQQIQGQVSSAAQILGLLPEQIFPVSAQKGLVAKVTQDQNLLERSRLSQLENALSNQLIPGKLAIMRAHLAADTDALLASSQGLLAVRIRDVVEQLVELQSLRGKNRGIMEHMLRRVELEKKEFDSSLVKLQGTRAVFTRLSSEVYAHLGMEVLKEETRITREAMASSIFSAGLRRATTRFFDQIRNNISLSSQKIDEIGDMMAAMYRKFSAEHGLTLPVLVPFSLAKYQQEIRQIEAAYQKQFGAAAILTMPQRRLMERFFDSIASRIRKSFIEANRDVEAWLKGLMAPLEAQIWEHRSQLKKRKQSIERVHSAAGGLEDKLQTLEELRAELEAKKAQLDALERDLRELVTPGISGLKAAA